MFKEDTSNKYRSRVEVANDISGGGFSAYFPRHEYQDNVVNAYLGQYASQYFSYFLWVCSLVLTQSSLLRNLCRHTGRGVPDIASQSSRYIYVSSDPSLNSDDPHHVATGTSCATIVRLYPSPSFPRSALPILGNRLNSDVQTAAAVITLLNDFLISDGQHPLGFLNPWLYKIGWMGFNDIATGHNPGCGTFGFTAEEGWDPVRPARPFSLRFRLR